MNFGRIKRVRSHAYAPIELGVVFVVELGPVGGLDDVLEQLAHHLLARVRLRDLRVVQLVEEQQVLGLNLVELGLPVGRFAVRKESSRVTFGGGSYGMLISQRGSHEELLLPLGSLLPQLVQLEDLFVEELVLHLVGRHRVRKALLLLVHDDRRQLGALHALVHKLLEHRLIRVETANGRKWGC